MLKPLLGHAGLVSVSQEGSDKTRNKLKKALNIAGSLKYIQDDKLVV
jgi:hypothetical protein